MDNVIQLGNKNKGLVSSVYVNAKITTGLPADSAHFTELVASLENACREHVKYCPDKPMYKMPGFDLDSYFLDGDRNLKYFTKEEAALVEHKFLRLHQLACLDNGVGLLLAHLMREHNLSEEAVLAMDIISFKLNSLSLISLAMLSQIGVSPFILDNRVNLPYATIYIASEHVELAIGLAPGTDLLPILG